MDKKTIRKMMKEKRTHMNDESFFIHSHIILNQILNHPIYQQSSTIAIYVSYNNEVDTINLIKESLKTHQVCVPKIENDEMNFYYINSLDDLKEGYFHILEPTTSTRTNINDIDLMIVPMLAFDKDLYRVGYGKGFYDRYFAKGYKGYKIGIAFSYQEVKKIQINQYDYALDEIITEITY